jgi:RNA polymerase sigma factor (sigma-70 family)
MLLKKYLASIAKYPRMSEQQQMELMSKWKETGDKKHLDEVYHGLLKSVYSYIKKVWYPRNGESLQADFMSMLQEANLAMYKSLFHYDPSRNTPPFHFAKKNMYFIVRNFYTRNTVVVLPRDIGSFTRTNNFTSLNSPISEEESGTGSNERDRQDDLTDSSNLFENIERKNQLKVIGDIYKKSKKLNPQKKFLLEQYYVEERTHEELGWHLGVCRSRVQQLLIQAVKDFKKEIDLHVA